MSDALLQVIEKGGSSNEIDAMAEHVEQCDVCGDTLEVFLAKDPTVVALRRSLDPRN